MFLDPRGLPNNNKSLFVWTGRKREPVDEMRAGGVEGAGVLLRSGFRLILCLSRAKGGGILGNSPVGSILLRDFNLNLLWFCRCGFR